MQPLVTFVVPVRHQENTKDWASLRERLSQTAASIAGQTNDDWKAVVVANEGADLPQLPAGFSVERVALPPNPHYDIKQFEIETFYDSIRLDKGRRVLSGMLAAAPTEYFMVVDDDDFVSDKLVDYVSRHKGMPGWYIKRGWLWTDGGRVLVPHNDFSNYCGTSHIVRADLYRLPGSGAAYPEDDVKALLGSHIKIAGILAAAGSPLAELPFRGAIYRVGQAGSVSASRSLLKSELLNRSAIRHPVRTLRKVSRFRPLSPAIKREFFGSSAVAG